MSFSVQLHNLGGHCSGCDSEDLTIVKGIRVETKKEVCVDLECLRCGTSWVDRFVYANEVRMQFRPKVAVDKQISVGKAG